MRGFRALQLTVGAHAEVFAALGGETCGLPETDNGLQLPVLLKGPEHGKFLDTFSRADWVTLAGPEPGPIVDAGHCLLETLLPNTFPRDLRHFLVDLSQAEARPGTAVLETAHRLQSHGEVVVSFSPESLAAALENLGEPTDNPAERAIARVRSVLNLGACLLFSKDSYAAADRADTRTLPPRHQPGKATAPHPGTTFATAYCAAGLMGIPEKSQLFLAAAAVETQLFTQSPPSWVEIERHIRQNPS